MILRRLSQFSTNTDTHTTSRHSTSSRGRKQTQHEQNRESRTGFLCKKPRPAVPACSALRPCEKAEGEVGAISRGACDPQLEFLAGRESRLSPATRGEGKTLGDFCQSLRVHALLTFTHCGLKSKSRPSLNALRQKREPRRPEQPPPTAVLPPLGALLS